MWSIKLRYAGLVLVLLQCGLASPAQVQMMLGQADYESTQLFA